MTEANTRAPEGVQDVNETPELLRAIAITLEVNAKLLKRCANVWEDEQQGGDTIPCPPSFDPPPSSDTMVSQVEGGES